jgi:L-methionine (R)-S-oxide reductase
MFKMPGMRGFEPRGLTTPAPLAESGCVDKTQQYQQALAHLRGLIQGERDEIAVMATVACELHHGLDHFDWTGFYRVVEPALLKIGPYQGRHGCLVISFDRGVCGQCAREKKTQIVPDVTRVPHHIACSSSTRSEIVVPVLDAHGRVRAVLDVDSDTPNAFDQTDASHLEEACRLLSQVCLDGAPYLMSG